MLTISVPSSVIEWSHNQRARHSSGQEKLPRGDAAIVKRSVLPSPPGLRVARISSAVIENLGEDTQSRPSAWDPVRRCSWGRVFKGLLVWLGTAGSISNLTFEMGLGITFILSTLNVVLDEDSPLKGTLSSFFTLIAFLYFGAETVDAWAQPKRQAPFSRRSLACISSKNTWKQLRTNLLKVALEPKWSLPRVGHMVWNRSVDGALLLSSFYNQMVEALPYLLILRNLNTNESTGETGYAGWIITFFISMVLRRTYQEFRERRPGIQPLLYVAAKEIKRALALQQYYHSVLSGYPLERLAKIYDDALKRYRSSGAHSTYISALVGSVRRTLNPSQQNEVKKILTRNPLFGAQLMKALKKPSNIAGLVYGGVLGAFIARAMVLEVAGLSLAQALTLPGVGSGVGVVFDTLVRNPLAQVIAVASFVANGPGDIKIIKHAFNHICQGRIGNETVPYSNVSRYVALPLLVLMRLGVAILASTMIVSEAIGILFPNWEAASLQSLLLLGGLVTLFAPKLFALNWLQQGPAISTFVEWSRMVSDYVRVYCGRQNWQVYSLERKANKVMLMMEDLLVKEISASASDAPSARLMGQALRRNEFRSVLVDQRRSIAGKAYEERAAKPVEADRAATVTNPFYTSYVTKRKYGPYTPPRNLRSPKRRGQHPSPRKLELAKINTP